MHDSLVMTSEGQWISNGSDISQLTGAAISFHGIFADRGPIRNGAHPEEQAFSFYLSPGTIILSISLGGRCRAVGGIWDPTANIRCRDLIGNIFNVVPR